jgi:hypothetical protein
MLVTASQRSTPPSQLDTEDVGSRSFSAEASETMPASTRSSPEPDSASDTNPCSLLHIPEQTIVDGHSGSVRRPGLASF